MTTSARTFDPANLRDWARILPDLAQLVYRLVRDPRVPKYHRVGLVAVCAYMVVPVDIIPDWIPFAGQLDDILVLTVGLRMILKRVPQEILLEHWSGTVDALEGLLSSDIVGGSDRATSGLMGA